MTSIAQWISGLFGSVDLAPSDITAALVLAAAAQRRRRKNRIKKALNPIIKAASNAATSQTSDQLSEDTASIDDSECPCKTRPASVAALRSVTCTRCAECFQGAHRVSICQ